MILFTQSDVMDTLIYTGLTKGAIIKIKFELLENLITHGLSENKEGSKDIFFILAVSFYQNDCS